MVAVVQILLRLYRINEIINNISTIKNVRQVFHHLKNNEIVFICRCTTLLRAPI